MSIRVGFFMDQIAGHVTNYHNLRGVADEDAELAPSWNELQYHHPEGRLESVHARLLPIIPKKLVGITRGAIEMHRGFGRGPYDVVFSNASVGIFFSRRMRRVPTLIDFDSTPLQLDAMPAYTPRRDPPPVEAVKFRAQRSMLQAAAVLHAWSHWAAQSAIDDYGCDPSRIVVNPPGVDLTYWCPPEQPRQAPVDRPIRVLFVGGDFTRKGGRELLTWFDRTEAGRFELDLVTREVVEPRAGIRIHTDLNPNTAELRSLYHRADLFVLPSLGECFGIATVEAMATGLPVIASDSGGTADIVAEGGNGYIVRAGAVEDLAAAIERLTGNGDRLIEMGIDSRRRAEARFDVLKNAQHTIELLKEIAHRGAGPLNLESNDRR